MNREDLKVGQIIHFNDGCFDLDGEIGYISPEKFISYYDGGILIILKSGVTVSWSLMPRTVKGIEENVGDFTNLSKFVGRYCRWVDASSVTDILYQPLIEVKSASAHLNCVECNYGDKFTTEANLFNNRFLCFTCRESYGYKYKKDT